MDRTGLPSSRSIRSFSHATRRKLHTTCLGSRLQLDCGRRQLRETVLARSGLPLLAVTLSDLAEGKNMNDDTPGTRLWPARKDLEIMASALAQERQPAHLLVTLLVANLSDRDLAQVIREVVGSFHRMPAYEPSVQRLVAQLEAERPQFFDPNRPGE
jgi:hypothetical protein